MSMISGLIDKLRKSEQEWNRSNMFELAHMCHEAADTIWELRDDLQRANAENAILRSELDAVGTAAYLYGRGNINDENAKLKEQVESLQPKDCEGNVLDIADTVHMLRSEYDGDHEWDDVVVELALTKWGGDRWIVRGSKGEAWACECTKTGYDEDAFEDSDDVEPFDDATLAETENAQLRELCKKLYRLADESYVPFKDVNPWMNEFDNAIRAMRELGIEVGDGAE